MSSTSPIAVGSRSTEYLDGSIWCFKISEFGNRSLISIVGGFYQAARVRGKKIRISLKVDECIVIQSFDK